MPSPPPQTRARPHGHTGCGRRAQKRPPRRYTGSPGHQPLRARRRRTLQDGHHCQQHQPPHGEIPTRGPPRRRQTAHGLEHHARSGHQPHHHQHGASPWAAEVPRRKDRVTAGNEQIHRAVVELQENPLGAALRQRVVNGGRQVQPHHRCHEHADAGKALCTPASPPCHQPVTGDKGCGERSPVAGRVGDFLAAALRAPGTARRGVPIHRPPWCGSAVCWRSRHA